MSDGFSGRRLRLTTAAHVHDGAQLAACGGVVGEEGLVQGFAVFLAALGVELGVCGGVCPEGGLAGGLG